MLIFYANSLYKIFVTVLILHWILTFLSFRAYLLEPPPWDYITKKKTQKNSKFKWGKKSCTISRVHIGSDNSPICDFYSFLSRRSWNCAAKAIRTNSHWWNSPIVGVGHSNIGINGCIDKTHTVNTSI